MKATVEPGQSVWNLQMGQELKIENSQGIRFSHTSSSDVSLVFAWMIPLHKAVKEEHRAQSIMMAWILRRLAIIRSDPEFSRSKPTRLLTTKVIRWKIACMRACKTNRTKAFIGSYQCYFRTSKFTINQTFTLPEILYETHENQVDTPPSFCRLKDCIQQPSNGSFISLSKLGIPANSVDKHQQTSRQQKSSSNLSISCDIRQSHIPLLTSL